MLRRTFDLLLASDSPEVLTRLLSAWRLWLVGALLGALLAGGYYALFPPPLRARAAVLVDNNPEEAWQYYPDRQLFYFLERETRKLEELAWSDAVLSTVAAQFEGLSVSELRGGILILEQPREGAWHFWAQDNNPQHAEALAAAWARAFVDQVGASLAISAELEAARQALNAALLDEGEPDPDEIAHLSERLARAIEDTPGISSFVQVSLSQETGLPTARTVSQGTYLLFGSLLGALSLALLALFAGPLSAGEGSDD